MNRLHPVQHLQHLQPVLQQRRHVVLAAALLLAGCGTSPPQRLYRLPLAAPGQATSQARDARDARAAAPVWELASAMPLPEYLERETLVVAEGDSGLVLLAGHQWAEPLRDSVPRILRHDLALLRGADHVWAAPAPPGVAIARVLQLSLWSFHADTQTRQLNLVASWRLLDPAARRPPLQGNVSLLVALAGTGASDIAAAHRQALWQLAQKLDAVEA